MYHSADAPPARGGMPGSQVGLCSAFRSVWAALLIAIPTGLVNAAPPPTAAGCLACHGPRGEGNTAIGAPALAGQQAAYLERQLQHFRAGRRGSSAGDSPGATMRAAVATIGSDADVRSVAAYYAALPATVPDRRTTGDLRNGQTRYLGNCGACHGARGEGNAALNAPRLAGLEGDYLRHQFAAFRSGTRGADPKDRFGKQMQLMAATLPTTKDVDDVIAFIHAQKATR